MKKLFSVLAVVMVAFTLTVPAFAATTYTIDDLPPVAEIWEQEGRDKYPYAMISNSGPNDDGSALTWYLYMFSTKPYYSGSGWNADITQNSPSDGYAYVVYNFSEYNTYWGNRYAGTNTVSMKARNVVKSTIDIKDSSGTVVVAGDESFFFPPIPLAELVLGVTEEELVTVAIPEMVGAMKVLVPCGVGLTALLVGLKLFGKRSLIFRS